jgi:hypothetical protein
MKKLIVKDEKMTTTTNWRTKDENDAAPVLRVFVSCCVCDFPPPLLEGVDVPGVVRLGGIITITITTQCITILF